MLHGGQLSVWRGENARAGSYQVEEQLERARDYETNVDKNHMGWELS